MDEDKMDEIFDIIKENLRKSGIEIIFKVISMEFVETYFKYNNKLYPMNGANRVNLFAVRDINDLSGIRQSIFFYIISKSNILIDGFKQEAEYLK